ncbi:MAG: selenocysteine-specific translation elongation factor [Caldilineaceae bacterium]|nr:selenocysteine-specific translation elongation factor [Caldilineaceae bacterium]
MRVIATAGHVDHGKSALVQALSGINPDRLAEEQKRGMTIDLGFAWIDLPIAGAENGASGQVGIIERRPSEQVGIIDVPGHIDFIKNMLAGVGSVDAALFIVAADEGIMPQTREHLAILDLLGVPTGVVALTKTDLIDDPEWLELVELDVRELLDGTCLADATLVPVSAHKGTELDALRAALSHALVALPPRRDRNRPRLPIDRIFTLSGFGTVVTGTLSDGHFAVGDAVEIMPDGPRGRIRGLQSHKQPIEIAQPGSRVAMNLSGIGTDEIRRGQVVCKVDTLRGTRLLDVSFRLLPDAPRPLVHNVLVDFFSGAAETLAHARLLGVEELPPGETGWLQLRLHEPVLVAAGDRFILRQPSPSVTLGGGVILNPHPRRRYRRFDPDVLARFATLARGAPDEILLQTLEREPLISIEQLIGRSGLGIEAAQSALAELQSAASIQMVDGNLWLTRSSLQNLTQTLAALLASYHHANPLKRGMPRGEARSRLRLPGPGHARDLPLRAFNALVERSIAEGLVAADDSFIWQAGFGVRFNQTQQRAVERTLAHFAASPYSPPTAAETLALLGGDEALLEALIEGGQLARLGGGVLFRGDDFTAMVAVIRGFMTENGSITLAQARDLFDTSRKYAQAILEEMDAQRITRREGDLRVLR